MGIEYSYELLCKDSMAVFFLGVLSTFLHTERQNCSVGTNDRYGTYYIPFYRVTPKGEVYTVPGT